MNLTTALTYWIIVALWATIFATAAYFYFVNKQTFGTVRLLLAVMALDSLRNIIENTYFGMYFGSKYGLCCRQLLSYTGQSLFTDTTETDEYTGRLHRAEPAAFEMAAGGDSGAGRK